MTRLHPLALLMLALGCTTDEPDPSGVFVGNPGKLGLTAASSPDVELAGTLRVRQLSLQPCGVDGTVQHDLDDLLLELGEDGKSLTFTGDAPLEVPPGAWCSLSLSIDAANLEASTVGPEGTERNVFLDFEELEVSVTGPEFVIDEQMLALQLAQPDWLAPLMALEVDDPDADGIDLQEQDPDTWSLLRAHLEERSALFLVAGPTSTTEDGAPVGAALDGEPLWSGDSWEPTYTHTGTTDTGTQQPNPVQLELTESSPLPFPLSTLQRPIRIADLVSVPGYSQEHGARLYPLGPDGTFNPDLPVPHVDAQEAAACTDGNIVWMVTTGTTEAVFHEVELQDLSIQESIPTVAAEPTMPRAAVFGADPVATWLEGETLSFATYGQPEASPLATSVLDHDLATHEDQALLVTWIERVTSPFEPAGTTVRMAASLDVDETVLFDAAPSGPNLLLPRVQADGDTIVLAHRDGPAIVAAVYEPSGAHRVDLDVAPGTVQAMDVAVVENVVVLSACDPDGCWVDLFDAASGQGLLEERVQLPDPPSEELRVLAWTEGSLEVVVVGVSEGYAWYTRLASFDALE